MVIFRTAFDQFTGTSNLIEVFSSSIFALDKGETERISMAEIHSMDNIQGSPGGDQQDVPALFALKNDSINLETDYRFAVPPDIPTLTAEAGDGHVVLTWNDVAESSIDRFLPDSLQNDFEGYVFIEQLINISKMLKQLQMVMEILCSMNLFSNVIKLIQLEVLQIMLQFLVPHIIWVMILV